MLQQPGGNHRDDSEYPPPEQPVDPPGNGPKDPAEDTLTQAQTDFDDALKSARKRLADARTAANNAVAAASAARTDDAKTQAQGDIGNARETLAAAVDAAKALAELYSDPGRLGERAIFVEAAETAQTRDLAKLLKAEAGTGWAGDVAAAEIPVLAAVAVNHRLRLDEDRDDADTLLKASDIPAVMYSSGKTVISGNLGSSGDQLQMRGMPIVYGVVRELRYSISRGSQPASDRIVYDLASIRNNRPYLVAGLTVTSAGLVVDIGGKGAEGTDFRSESFLIIPTSNLLRRFSPQPYDAGTGLGNGYDLTLDFGRPTSSPEGNAEHYWETALMPTVAQTTAAGGDSGWLQDGDRTLPLGVYQVRLSNHVGLDRNSEDPDTDEFYTADDENFYLTYAAYGFMDFQRRDVPSSASFAERGIQRVFPFHVGYDAFKNEVGMRTADVSEAMTSAKFKGRTIAVQFRFSGDLVFLSDPNTKRMRGDVELTATIGTANDTITGKISNMEDWDPKGYWEPSTTVTGDVNFASDGRIDAKGEFTGTFANYPAGFERGGYRGNLYGPLDSLEAAGAWAMSPASGQLNAIAGGFGAAIVREDGTYGRVVQGTEVSASD